MLKSSGIWYRWNPAAALGARVEEIRAGNAAGPLLDPDASYTVTVNNFLAAGGDNFTALTQGRGQVGGPIDLDALINNIQSLSQPFSAAIEGRISIP